MSEMKPSIPVTPGIPVGIVAALGLTQIIGYGTLFTASASLRRE